MTFKTLQRTSDPQTPVLTTAEAKIHLRVDHSDEDDYIDALVDAATKFAEEFTRRALITQTWKAEFSDWPHACAGFRFFELPRPRLQAITSLKYYDVNGTQQTVDPSKYTAEGVEPGVLTLKTSFSKPGLDDDRRFPVEIVFTAGYGDDAEDIPELLRNAIRLMVKHFYEIRMPVLENINATKVPLSVTTILKLYRYAKL